MFRILFLLSIVATCSCTAVFKAPKLRTLLTSIPEMAENNQTEASHSQFTLQNVGEDFERLWDARELSSFRLKRFLQSLRKSRLASKDGQVSDSEKIIVDVLKGRSDRFKLAKLL